MEPERNGVLKGVVLAVSSLSAFMTPFVVSSVNIALPAIAREFSLNAVMEGWIVTTYLMSTTILLVPFGRIADIFGRKRYLTLGIAVFSAASLLAGLAWSVAVLLLARVLQGLGGAMMFGTGMAILTSVYPVRERGKAIGINVAATYLGLSLGPVIGGHLTSAFGWRSNFLLIVPVGLTALLLLLRKVRGEWAEAWGERFDLSGSLIYAAAVMALMYGFTRLSDPIGITLVVLGMAGLYLFVRWEMAAGYPVLNMKLFRNNLSFTFSNLAALINYSATFAVSFILSLYLQYVKGLEADQAGLVMVAQPVVMFLFSPLAGWLSDRVEPRTVASAGMALTALGLGLLMSLGRTTPLLHVVAALLLLGFGFALFSSPNTNAVMSSVPQRYYGVASGTLSTMRMLGQTFSMGIVMLIIGLFLGRAPIGPANVGLYLKSVKLSFAIFSLLCLFGVFASLARGRVHEEEI